MNNTAKRFRLGPWTIDAERGEITDSQGTQHLEPKVMAVLLCLAENEDAVVTKQQLVDTVWNGRPVSDEVISRCISALRTHLGDDHKAPKYIRTFPKRGYRLVPDVEPVEADPLSPVVISQLAITSLWANDNETAEMLFPVAIELGLRGQLHTDSYVLLLIRRGHFEEARAMARGPAPDAPDNPTWFDYLLDCIAKAEHCGEAGDALAGAESVSPRVQLIAWALLGNNENVKQVARMLEDDVAAFDTELLFVEELEAFRRDPEFGRLLDAIGIADYWRQSGCTWSEIGVSCGRY